MPTAKNASSTPPVDCGASGFQLLAQTLLCLLLVTPFVSFRQFNYPLSASAFLSFRGRHSHCLMDK